VSDLVDLGSTHQELVAGRLKVSDHRVDVASASQRIFCTPA
jgi:hypothetical protein